MQATADAMAGSSGLGSTGSSSSSSSSAATQPSTRPNTAALPNPWAAPGSSTASSSSVPSMGAPAMPGFGAFGAAPGSQGATGGFPNPYAGMGGLGAMGGGPMGGAVPDMDTTLNMMQNPAMQAMMQQMLSNPAFLDQVGGCTPPTTNSSCPRLADRRADVSSYGLGYACDGVCWSHQMAGSNPMLRQMLDANPHMRTMMTSPQFVQQMTDPNTLRAVMQLQRSGLLPGPGYVPTAPLAQGVTHLLCCLADDLLLPLLLAAWPLLPSGPSPLPWASVARQAPRPASTSARSSRHNSSSREQAQLPS